MTPIFPVTASQNHTLFRQSYKEILLVWPTATVPVTPQENELSTPALMVQEDIDQVSKMSHRAKYSFNLSPIIKKKKKNNNFKGKVLLKTHFFSE